MIPQKLARNNQIRIAKKNEVILLWTPLWFIEIIFGGRVRYGAENIFPPPGSKSKALSQSA